MKKILIKAGILLVIFIAAFIGFSKLFDRTDTEDTEDMKAASLPVLYMEVSGSEANRMYGYIREMNASTLRESITPLGTTKELTVLVDTKGNDISSVTYEVSDISTGETLENARIKTLETEDKKLRADFKLQSSILMNREYSLKFTVETEEGTTAYYYTRLVQRTGTNVGTYLEFVQNFYEQSLDKSAAQNLSTYLESDNTVTNSSFTSVNIHSSLDQVTWGNLQPKIVKKATPQIKELNETTASISMEYLLSAQEEDDKTEYYQVQEFYRLRYSNSQVMLLDFERNTQQIFDAGLSVLDSRGINLGVASKSVQYMAHSGGDVAAFVQAGDLWMYNRSANKAVKIFSFRNLQDAENIDERNENSSHEIKIIRVEESGDVEFVVYGYMNRGDHEGDVGIGVYYYNAERNTVDEQIFLSSTMGVDYLEKDIAALSYVNKDNQLYLLMEGRLYRIDLENNTQEIVKEGILFDNFYVSRKQSKIVWMEEEDVNAVTHITLMDLDTGEIREITAAEGDYIKAIGFINEDFVLGLAHQSDVITDGAGNTTFAMYAVQIQDFEGNVIKDYRQDNTYITNVNAQEGMLELTLAQRIDGVMTQTGVDHIMNNQQENDTSVEIYLTVSERKGTQVILEFPRAGKTKNLLNMSAKFVKKENPHQLELSILPQESEMYYVYAKGGLSEVYTSVSEAIQDADAQAGVVLNRQQQYVWERGNRPDSYKMTADQLLPAIAAGNLDETSLQEALGDNYTVLNLTGCTLDSVYYQVANNYPVVSRLASGEVVVIVGYDNYNSWLYYPSTQQIAAMASDDSTAQFQAAGNIFLSYREK